MCCSERFSFLQDLFSIVFFSMVFFFSIGFSKRFFFFNWSFFHFSKLKKPFFFELFVLQVCFFQ